MHVFRILFSMQESVRPALLYNIAEGEDLAAVSQLFPSFSSPFSTRNADFGTTEECFATKLFTNSETTIRKLLNFISHTRYCEVKVEVIFSQ